MAKFYAKMRIGKVSAIGTLADNKMLLLAVVCRVNSCYVSNHTIIIFIAAALLLVVSTLKPELMIFMTLASTFIF